MPLNDKRGVAVTTDNRAALERYETAVELLLGYFVDPLAEIDAALAEDPGFAMGHCFRGGLMAVAAERASEPELRRSLAAAERLAGGANDRERGHIAALRAWADGDLAGAARHWNAVLTGHPRDVFALQMAHMSDFYLGQSRLLRDRVAAVLPAWDEAVPGFSFVLGMHAFGLEEMGEYGRAEATGRRAIELEPRDPWAAHAVAHVMEMQGRLEDGVDWLTGRAESWSRACMFAYHNWWHVALYHLELGDAGRVLELYDTRIRPRPSRAALETIDATSLLWRLTLRGIDVGNRWRELADTWEALDEDAYYAFNDIHATMAFVADDRPAAVTRTIVALERRAAEQGANAEISRDVGLPVARALEAFGAGDYATAVELLRPARHIAYRCGGSHAQRDILGLTAIEAALRGGHGRAARTLAAERTELKPRSPANRLLSARAGAVAA